MARRRRNTPRCGVVTAVEARLLPATSIPRPPTEEDLEAALQAAQEEVDRLLAGRQEAPVDCTAVAVAALWRLNRRAPAHGNAG